MIEVQCPSTLKIKQLNNRSLVCQQLDIQRVSNLLAMIQHVGLFSEFLLKQGIHNSLCAPTWAHGRTLLYLWYKDMGFQWCWFWLPLLIMEFATKKRKEKRFNINAKIPGCSTVSRGGTEYVCALFWPFWPTIPCQIQREGQSSRCNVMAQYVPAVCTLHTSVKCILEGRKAFRHLGIISNFVLPWNCVTLFWRHYILYCLSLGPFFFFLYVFHFLNFILYMSRCCTFSEFLLLLLWCWSNALCLCVWNIN